MVPEGPMTYDSIEGNFVISGLRELILGLRRGDDEIVSTIMSHAFFSSNRICKCLLRVCLIDFLFSFMNLNLFLFRHSPFALSKDNKVSTVFFSPFAICHYQCHSSFYLQKKGGKKTFFFISRDGCERYLE